MDIAKTAYDILKDVGPIVCKYGKYQLKFKEFVRGFDEMKDKLQYRRDDIQSALDSQLRCYGKIAKAEVAKWLLDAGQKIIAKEVEDLVNKGGCFCHICRAKKLEGNTNEMEKLFNDGAAHILPNQSLVRDDPSIMVDSVRRVEEAKRRLHSRIDDIESTLKSQLQHGKIEKLEVRVWLEKAKDVIKEVEAQVNSCSSAVILEEKIREMNAVYEPGAAYTLPNQILVTDDPLIKGVALSSVRLHGRDSILAEILKCLTLGDVRSVAVWGMGGVGKTTIMKKVNDQLLEESKFKKVVWVTISKEFNVFNVQNEIVRQLNGTKNFFTEDQDATWRAGVVSKMLLQGGYLLIFDDVWEEFPFEEAGIPIGDYGDNNFKFAMTTRFRQAAQAIDCEIITLEPLSKDESLKLFLGNVGSAVVSAANGKIREDVEAVLKLIVEECDGLPLALVTVARSMKGKSSLNLWQNAFNEVKQGNRKVFNTLKFSYDSLEDPDEQRCFLYVALYPEDAEIRKAKLIEHWIEEGFLAEKKTRYAMICKGHAVLKKLEDRCLLECIIDNYYAPHVADKDDEDRECTRMHDLLRAMALDIMSSRVLVKSGVGLTELPKDVEWKNDLEKVSLMHNNRITKIPSTMASPKCSMLTTLRLESNYIEIIPETFFENLLQLKILDLTRSRKLSVLPNSVSMLVNLTTLLLGWCGNLKELPSLLKLRVLTKLDLSGTGIKNLPEGLEMLWNLKYLDLDNLVYLRAMKVEVERLLNKILSKLSELEYLVVDHWIQLKGGDIGRLVNLESFGGQFPTVQEWSIFARSRGVGLKWYRVYIGERKRHNYIDFTRNITCSMIYTCGEPDFLPVDVKVLQIGCWKGQRNLNDMSGFQDATDLRILQIYDCESLETLTSLPCLRLNPLQRLKVLSLIYLVNLVGLFELEVGGAPKLELPPATFSSLINLQIGGCMKLKNLISSRLVGYLQNLEEIEVCNCYSMEEIFGSEVEEREETCKLPLPKLKKLKMYGLRELRSICSPTAVLVCDSIKELDIRACGNLICENVQGVFGSGFNPFQSLEILRARGIENLKSVFDEGVLALAPTSNWFPLTKLYVSYCHSLKKLFSPWLLLGNLQNLETIEVENCKQMQEIISSSLEEEESLKLTLPKLKELNLKDMPSLKGICSNSNVLICNSLSHLTIRECWKLKRIPLYIPQLDDSQPSIPPTLKVIEISASIWESSEWDHTNAKDVLLPLCKLKEDIQEEEEEEEEEDEV